MHTTPMSFSYSCRGGSRRREATMKIRSNRFFHSARHVLGALALASGLALAAEAPKAPPPTPTPNPQGLDTRIQSLKQEAMELNRDLLVLEEELLFPASKQVAVFVLVGFRTLFVLYSGPPKFHDSIMRNYFST